MQVVSIAIHSCRIDGGLKQQVGSVANVLFTLGKEICRKKRKKFVWIQQRALCWAFFGSGMT